MIRLRRTIAFDLIGALVVAFAGVASEPLEAQDDVAKNLVGLWRLTAAYQQLTDGTIRKDPLSVGYLVYADTVHVCFVAMNPDRPQSASTSPTPAEALESLRDLSAYCATVEVHAREGYVLHHVEIGRATSIGAVRKRFFKFDGPDRLTLKVDSAELGTGIAEGVLIWERVKK